MQRSGKVSLALIEYLVIFLQSQTYKTSLQEQRPLCTPRICRSFWGNPQLF